MARATFVDADRRRLGLRVVVADRLDDAAVARRARVCHHDAPDRILASTDACESDSDSHWTDRLATLAHHGLKGGHLALSQLLHELLLLAELLDELVDVRDRRARAAGDAQAPRSLD